MSEEERLVMIVEDDDLFASIVAQKFSLEFIPTIHAASGDEALQLLQGGQKPDIVLLDIHMAGMDGFEFLEKLRADPTTAKLPVIVLSNFNDPKDIERSKSLGVLQHVQKVSLTPAEVVEMVKKELKH